MVVAPANDRACRISALAGLHACRTQAELDRGLSLELARAAPAVTMALSLADEAAGTLRVRLTAGDACPLRGRERACAEDWPLPAAQRLPIRFRDHVLGELWIGEPVDDGTRRDLDELLVHYGTALVNLTLHAESRQATEDYCASLQALEEGIVLFQEEDPAAVMARLLSLAASMVQATAGALYVLREVGRTDSGLCLEQALGMPESLLATFHGVDGCAWPDVLLEQPAHVAARDAGGPLAMLAPECVPAVLRDVVVLPLRYHGVQAGICLLFNPQVESPQPSDFLGRLQTFGQLAAALLHRLSLEALNANNISVARELEIAATIQQRSLPSASPPTDEYEFAWKTIAAKNIGGDSLDVMMSETGDVHVVVADASGHGINSALLMTSFRAHHRGNAAWMEPGELAASLNREVVHEVGPTGMFITAMLMRLERGTRRLSYCSAGHNPTLWWHAAEERIERIESAGPPLGFVADADYAGADRFLAAGDVLLLYTDGVTEATDGDLEMFGEERLEALLRQHASAPAEQLVTAVRTELARFTCRDHCDDDVSLVVVKVR